MTFGHIVIPTAFGPQTVSRMVQHYRHMARYAVPAQKAVTRSRLRSTISAARREAALLAQDAREAA